MNDSIHAVMHEATRLVRTGGLREATRRIQRALGGGAAPVVDPIVEPALEPLVPPGQAPTRAHRPDRKPGVRPFDGQFLAGSYTNPAGTRAYKLYVPRGYSGQRLPLIVMLHGCTQDPDDFAAGTRMNALADAHPCFVVYPAQTPSANQSKCWNWFTTADQHRGQGEPSIIAGISGQVMRDYAVDPRRVYVAGLSAGGAMAGIMGVTYPDLYAAVGIHSGLPYAAAHDLPSALAAMKHGGAGAGRRGNGAVPTAERGARVPVIVFHGDRDTRVHPRNGEAVIDQWKAAHAGNGTPQGQTELSATVRRGRVPDGHAYTCVTYHETNGEIPIEQWRIHGAAHAWSGGSASGSFTDPRGPDATSEMIRFFDARPLREP